MAEKRARYRRVLIKLSGEALAGDKRYGIMPDVISRISEEIRDIQQMGVEVALVVGAGNIFRGAMAEKLGIHRITGDHMGILATIMNSLALQSSLENLGVPARVMSAIDMKEVAEPYIIRKAIDHLEHGRVVIASGGTGHPFFTTDTAASLRAVEMGSELLLKATRVDGVYTSDPEKDPTAKRMEQVSYLDVIKGQLRVMDLTAISLCMDNNLPIVVFNLFKPGSLRQVVTGEPTGTLITHERGAQHD